MSRILSEVAKDDEAHYKKTSYDGSESIQWKKLDSVMNIATIPELKHICCNHPSPTVRMAMFLHVVEKYPHEAIKIAVRKANDFDTVSVLDECENYITLVSCERFENLYGYEGIDKRFTKEERASLEKYRGPDAVSIVDGEFLKIEKSGGSHGKDPFIKG